MRGDEGRVSTTPKGKAAWVPRSSVCLSYLHSVFLSRVFHRGLSHYGLRDEEKHNAYFTRLGVLRVDLVNVRESAPSRAWYRVSAQSV